MPETMQGLVFRGDGHWGLERLPVPGIQALDDVLLKVDRASVCGTDIHILATPPGHPATPGSILGHEYVATVKEVGQGVRDLQPGDRVVIDPNITCGTCEYCRLGMTNACSNMTTLGIFRHGGLAQFSLAPARALHRINQAVPLDRATLAEPLSCVLHAFEKSALVPGESVAILGAGPIGLLFAMLFRAAGAGKILVVEPVEFRRRMAEQFGVDYALDPAAGDIVAEVKAATRVGTDIVVDAAGTLLPEAVNLVRRGGRVLLFGMNQHANRALNQYVVTRHEISILGSFIQRTAFPKVVKILEAGLLPVEKLVTHRLPLGEVYTGLEAMKQGQAIKVAVSP
jgi:(R,R)-butanediol dehydrogenase / meso-butanediol dehydrogenase / diacetyl reductase